MSLKKLLGGLLMTAPVWVVLGYFWWYSGSVLVPLTIVGVCALMYGCIYVGGEIFYD